MASLNSNSPAETNSDMTLSPKLLLELCHSNRKLANLNTKAKLYQYKSEVESDFHVDNMAFLNSWTTTKLKVCLESYLVQTPVHPVPAAAVSICIGQVQQAQLLCLRRIIRAVQLRMRDPASG
ncbi:hypothetical protein STEG23_017733 [Scotinomys teguina]